MKENANWVSGFRVSFSSLFCPIFGSILLNVYILWQSISSQMFHISRLSSVIASVSACYNWGMPTEGQTPSWLISYKISLCYLLSLIAVLSNIHTALNSNGTRRETEREREITPLRQHAYWDLDSCTWSVSSFSDSTSVTNCMLLDFPRIIGIVSEDITRLLRD